MRTKRLLGLLIAILLGCSTLIANFSEGICNFLPCQSILSNIILSPTALITPNLPANSIDDFNATLQLPTATTIPTKTLQDMLNDNEATYLAQSTATARAQPTKYP